MKMAESGNIVLGIYIIDFDDIQVLPRHLSLSLNACKIIEVFLTFSGRNLKKAVINLQALRHKLKCLNETCISSKSIMLLPKTILPDSAIFVEKKKIVGDRLWAKSEFLLAKRF